MSTEREKSVFLWAKQHHLGVFDIMSSIDHIINNQTLVNAKQLFLCSNQPPPPSLPTEHKLTRQTNTR